MQDATRDRLNRQLQEGVEACNDCHDACLGAMSYCLRKGGFLAEEPHLTLLLDCAEICRANAGFLLRNSDLLSRTSAVCALVCERCAESADRMGADQRMQAVAQVCRRCVAACRELGMVG